VAGSREALFALAQTVIDPKARTADGEPAIVLCPNPFYQIYEGAALLAGAQPYFANSDPARNFACDYAAVPADIWARTQLLYVCSPGNPTGAVLTLDDWRELFALSDRYGFVIASDECYSEIYFDEAQPPLGALEAAHRLGRGFERLVMLSSLSKRSNVPGMRSGFVAGDAAILKQLPAVPHLSRLRAVDGYQSGQHRGLERRDARAREPREVRAEVFHRHADARRGARRAAAGRRVLPVGRRVAHRSHGRPSSPSACTPTIM
jgi:aspartate/methionine/tyrosine aminotransferase